MIAALAAALLVIRGFGGGAAAAGAAPAAEVAAEVAELAAATEAQPPAPPVPAAERSARSAAVERLIARAIADAGKRTGGAATPSDVTVAVHAVEVGPLRAGTLVSRLADTPLRPASNMKLMTTAAALTLLGASFSFETHLEATGTLAGGTLAGDLIVRAGADPLCDREGTGVVEERLDVFARALRERGIERVSGDLVLDEGPYQEPAVPPGWPDASQHWADYCALSGGFSVNGGVLRATLARGGGNSLRVAVHPAPHGLRESYRVSVGARNDVRVGATSSTCTVKGELPASEVERWSASFAHPDPVALFGSVLRDRLARGGVAIAGETLRTRNAPRGERIATLRSPLADALVPVNTSSINGVADQVFLALGAAVEGAGTRAGGMAAGARALARLGVPSEGFHQVDGSGLSRDNRATARQIVALLEAVDRLDPAAREAFFASLPVAGRTGTLEDRLDGTAAEGRVFAKTGWIAGASALSGLARTDGGRRVLFSILVAYPRELGGLNAQVFKPMQDEIVLALFEDLP